MISKIHLRMPYHKLTLFKLSELQNLPESRLLPNDKSMRIKAK